MAASTNNNDTIHFDNDGNIVPAGQSNVAQNSEDRPAAVKVMGISEVVNLIIRYLPASSYRSCSQINRLWRTNILFTSLNYMTFNTEAQKSFESTPRRIFILSAYILQYSAAVDTGLPVGGVSANQFVFSCQTRSDSVDSYGSSSSNSDHKSGESSGYTCTSGESRGMSHLQRHHTHQPGHDIEPYHSFHTYQSSAIVPNVYYKTGIQLPPHLSSPPPLPPPPILAQQQQQQPNYSFPSPPAQQQSLSQGGPLTPSSHPQQQHQYTTTDATQTIDQMAGFPSPLLPPPRDFLANVELSSSHLHHYEADMMAVDVRDISLSPTQVLLPSHGISTFPTPGSSSSSTPQQRQQQKQQPVHLSSSFITGGIPMPAQQQHQQPQQPMLRVVPCPYELPTEGSIQYEQSMAMLKKRSRTNSGSARSADSSNSGGCYEGEPSSTSILQGGSYIPYASPIMEESSSPSGSVMAYGSPYATGVASSSSSAMMSPTGGAGGGGIRQGSSSGRMSRSSGKELASEYQRALLEQNQRQLQQLQQQQWQRQRRFDGGDDMMDTTSVGGRGDQADLAHRSSTMTGGPAPLSDHHNQQQRHHHHHGNDRHHHYQQHDQGDYYITESFNQASTSSNSGSTYNHHHNLQDQHQQRQQRRRQQQPARPSRNWSMAIQTFYYQTRALNAMIVACREHMLSPEGQGGTIVEKTKTSRIIWNETTRQEHIWTITPTLMDRTNPGDIVEADYDPQGELETA